MTVMEFLFIAISLGIEVLAISSNIGKKVNKTIVICCSLLFGLYYTIMSILGFITAVELKDKIYRCYHWFEEQHR